MMPADGLNQLRDSDAIYLGAVGFPGVPDHVSLWGEHGARPDRGHGVGDALAGATWGRVVDRLEQAGIRHLGEAEAAGLVMDTLRAVAKHGPRTKDLGGAATTREVGDAIAARIGATG